MMSVVAVKMEEPALFVLSEVEYSNGVLVQMTIQDYTVKEKQPLGKATHELSNMYE